MSKLNSGSQAESAKLFKTYSEPSTPKDQKDRANLEFGMFMPTAQAGSTSFPTTHSNNTSEKDYNTSRGQRNRPIRKPVNNSKQTNALAFTYMQLEASQRRFSCGSRKEEHQTNWQSKQGQA